MYIYSHSLAQQPTGSQLISNFQTNNPIYQAKTERAHQQTSQPPGQQQAHKHATSASI